MIQAFQFNNLPVAIALWLSLFLLGYFLARRGQQLRIKYTESHPEQKTESHTNPSANKRARNFIILAFVLGTLWLLAAWYFAQIWDTPEIFTTIFGCLLLVAIPIVFLYVQSVSFGDLMNVPGAVAGADSRTYAPWVQQAHYARISAYWFVVYIIFLFLTESWLFLGGAVPLFLIFVGYTNQARILRAKSPNVAVPKDNPPVSTEELDNTAVKGHRFACLITIS